MRRTPSLLWIGLICILLLPYPAGKLLLNLAGGLIFLALIVPIALGGIGWIGWRLIQSRMIKCETCGVTTFAASDNCPVCGANLPKKNSVFSAEQSKVASDVTIDISAENIDES